MHSIIFLNKKKSFNNIILFIFIFTLLNGVFRKWIFPNNSFGNFIQLIQIILPFFLVFSENKWIKPWKNQYIFSYILILIFFSFNPMNKTIFHGFLGFLIYTPFFFVLTYYIDNRSNINIIPLIKIFLYFCFFEIILAFIQYQLPADNFLNRYADIDKLGIGQSIAMVGNSVRVTGTFSYISGFSSFLIFTSIFSWVLVRINYNLTVVFFLIIGTLSATLMTGSRSVMLINLIIYFCMIKSEFSFSFIFGFFKKFLFTIILFFLISFIFNGLFGIDNVISASFENFENRRIENKTTGEEESRIFQDLSDVLNFNGNHPFFGVGLGATYQGATALFGTSDYVIEYGGYEGELPRIILEGGFFLFFFRLLLIGIICSKLNIYWYSKIIFFIILAYGTSLVFNVYNSFFFSIGLIFLDNSKYLTNKLNVENFNF